MASGDEWPGDTVPVALSCCAQHLQSRGRMAMQWGWHMLPPPTPTGLVLQK